MIDLKALAVDDGYAIVEDTGQLFIVRPPFHRKDKRKISSESFRTAILQHDFELAEGQFRNWDELISAVRAATIAARKKSEEKVDSDRIRSLVRRAPLEVARRFIVRVDTELLSHGQVAPSLHLLQELTLNESVKNDPALLHQCAELLGKLIRMNGANERSEDLESLRIKFPGVDDEGFRVAKLIQQKQSLLNIGS